MDREKIRRLKKYAFFAAGATVLLILGLVLIIYTVVLPPPGAPLAALDLRSGQRFRLEFVADGQIPRLWLDLDCESCSFPITGSITLSAGGKTIASSEISAGNRRDRAWGGTDRKLEQHLLYIAPKQPAGTRVTISGALVVGPARGNWSTNPVKGAPPPKVEVLRLTVAP